MFANLLLSAYRLEIEPLDVEGAARDELAGRTTLKPKYRGLIKVRGQFKYTLRRDRSGLSADGKALSSTLGGAIQKTEARVVVTSRDAKRANWTPTKDDRLVRVVDKRGDVENVNLYVTKAVRVSELPGGFGDWHVELTDQTPARAATT